MNFLKKEVNDSDENDFWVFSPTELGRLREGITLFFEALILSGIIINFIPINVFLYSLMTIGIWLIVLVNLKPKTNKEKMGQFLIVSVANIIALLIMRWRDGWKSIFENTGYIGIVPVALLLLLIFFYTYVQVVAEKIPKEKKLFPRREQDLQRILNRCEQMDMLILGIEAVWGDGKTFLIEKLQGKLIEKNCEVITIDVLACNLDNLPQILLEELDDILYKNRILSKYSGKLKKFFSKEKKMEFLGELLSKDNAPYTKAFDSLKDELGKIDKNVVIIYEDIDRIIDGNLIRKIFYISEKLTYEQKNIKVIYQYNPVHLKTILGEDVIKAGFVEKYIPYTVSLSGINFLEVMEQLLEEKKIPTERLNKDDFSVLNKESESFGKIMSGSLDKPDKVMGKVNDLFSSIQSIRKAEHFLTELNGVLEHEEFLLEYKNIIRDVIFIKHFFPQVYGQFKADKTFNDYFEVMTKTAEKEEKKDPVYMESITKAEEIMALNDDDFEKYIAYRLLKQNKEKGEDKNEFYEKITRIIRHLLEPWQSAMTDYQWIVEKMTPVLEMDLNAEDVGEEYKKVVDSVLKEDRRLYQANIRFFVNSPWVLYFKVFARQYIDDENDYFEKLLELYFKVEQPKNIGEKFFYNLQPIFENMSKKQLNVFLKIVIKNTTNLKYEYSGFYIFLQSIYKAMGKCMYFLRKDGEDGEYIEFISFRDAFQEIKDQLKKYEAVLKKYGGPGKYLEFDKEVITNILEFCDLVIHSKSVEATEPEIPESENERPLSNDEFLKKMKTAGNEEKEKLIKKYAETRIYNPRQLLNILKEVEEQEERLVVK